MSDQAVEREGWGSAFGFIVTSIGFAVGLGAIWKFPYMIGMNGGGLFLLMCIIFILIIAVPLCWAELTLGRYTQKSAVLGMRELTHKGSPWVILAWSGLAACMVLASYYVTIVCDVLWYIFKFVSGGFRGMTIDQIGEYYNGLQISMGYKFAAVILIYVLTIVVIVAGVQKGLERANKILIPALFIFLVILGIRGLMLPGAMEGIKWMFTPDFSQMSPQVVMAGLNQCFFLSGCAMATLFSFGSYLGPETSDIPFYGPVIVCSNIVVAILAGVAIFTALFSYNMDIASGSGLVFRTLPYVFMDMSGGIVWGTLFFFLVFAAGWSSFLGLYEGFCSLLSESIGVSRVKGIVVGSVITFILSIPAILYTTAWANVKPLGMDLFTFMDFVAMLILVPIGAILISIFTGTVFWDKFQEHSAVGAKYFRIPKITRGWYIVVLPAVTLLVAIVGIASYF